MAKLIKFIWIGKLKQNFWENAAKHYWGRLSRYYRLQKVCLKDGPKHFSTAQKMQYESQSILKKTSLNEINIILDSQGQYLSSEQFACKLNHWLQESNKIPCFIIGGAFGLNDEIREKSNILLSLGPMTLPHELTRIVLLEQIYRATAINLNHPYHH